MATTNTRIGVIVGSLRRGSWSRRVARALIDRAPDGWQCSFIEIGSLPLYDEDFDANPPGQWTRFRQEVSRCDALLFVTPEYNRSIPGVLKNATDIGSRPAGENVFDGKPAAVVSVTPHTSGAMGANHALRQSFIYINLAVMAQPEAYISGAGELVDARGKVANRKGDKLLRNFMSAFGDWVARVGSAKAGSFDEFMQIRQAASNAYIQGDSAPLELIEATEDPATFFPPNGARVVGAKAVTRANRAGAKNFRRGSTGRFEVLASGSNGGLAWWSGIQHAQAHMQGKRGAVPMKLRTTEVFRRDPGGWKLVHRHADMIE